MGLAAAFLAVAPRLAQWGLSRPFFYLVLIPLGLGSAAFLRQALDAAGAEIHARLWFGTVRVGGPVAVAALVVGGGVWLLQGDASDLRLLVRVPYAARDVDLTRATLEVLAAGGAVRPESVEAREAHFTLASRLRGAPLRLVGSVPGYDLPDTAFTYPPDGLHWLELVPQRTVMKGTVVGPDGAPLDRAVIEFDGGLVQVVADHGAFRAELPRPPGATVRVRVRYRDQVGYAGEASTPGDLALRWSPP